MNLLVNMDSKLESIEKRLESIEKQTTIPAHFLDKVLAIEQSNAAIL